MAKDDPARERRLADALRTNLHRRKAQSRERSAEGIGEKAQRHAAEDREADA